jgi:ketosteroid isomerase-like protein
MSREQIEQIEQIYSAFNRGDFDSVLESWDDDTEFVAPGGHARAKQFPRS